MMTVKHIYASSKGYRARIILLAALGVISVVASLGFIWASKRVIDIASGDVQADFVAAAVATASLLLFQTLLRGGNQWLSIRIQTQLSNHLRHNLFTHLMQTRWSETERFGTGDLMTRIMHDITEVVRLLVQTVPQIVITAFELLSAFLFLYWMNTGLAWTLLLITPFFLILSKAYLSRMRRFSRLIKKSDSRINTLIQESMMRRTVIKSFEYVPIRVSQLVRLQRRLMSQVKRRGNLSVFSGSVISLGFTVGYLTAFIWGSVQIRAGVITFGTMTAFLQLANKIQAPALDLIRLIPSCINASTASERLCELLHLPKEEQGASLRLPGALTVSLQHVSFAYSPREKVLQNLCMEFRPDSMTAIVGETGAGKTTLIRLLLGLLGTQEGTLTLSNGLERVPISPRTRANFIYVPQGNTLLGTSIRNNLHMGNPHATLEQMHEALHVAAADFVFELPDQLETRVGEQGLGLSEGQAQRIAIARALLRPGAIVLMDEATSALDAETETLFLERLRKHALNRTIIFVTHHAALADRCDVTYRI